MQVVLYHSNCADGLIAAYEVWRTAPKETLCIPITYSEFQKQDAETFIEDILHRRFEDAKSFSCFPYSNDQLLDVISGTPLFLVDICVDPAKLKALSNLFETVNVFDHHKSSWEMCEEAFHGKIGKCTEDDIVYVPFTNTRISFSLKRSGAYHTFTELNGKKHIPRYVELVSDYNTWIKRFHDSDSFVAGLMGIRPENLDELDELISDGIDTIITVGNYFNGDRLRRARSVCKRHTEIDIVYKDITYKAALVNTNLDISSFVGNILVSDYNFDIGISYCVVSDKEVGFSVRSNKPLDSTVLSKSFGGGGHAQASGFSCTFEQWVRMMEEKRIVIS